MAKKKKAKKVKKAKRVAAPTRPKSPKTSTKPVVGVVMGSDSDLKTVGYCLKQLGEFDIRFEVRVISAHRTPDSAREYAVTAAERGLKVLIAAAGMSAALAGVLAAHTTLPVIGVPVASGAMVGVDAALSTMQMPPGIPVGCMAIGAAGAINGAIFAAQILSLSDEKLVAKLAGLKRHHTSSTKKKDAAVRKRTQRK